VRVAALVSNLSRKNLSNEEQAVALQEMKKECGTWAQVARETGKSLPSIFRLLKEENLPDVVKESKLNAAQKLALAKACRTEKEMEDYLPEVKGLTAQQIPSFVRSRRKDNSTVEASREDAVTEAGNHWKSMLTSFQEKVSKMTKKDAAPISKEVESLISTLQKKVA
jgi:uncharacterized membrane-anchored protein YjiN (DUF445 family)